MDEHKLYSYVVKSEEFGEAIGDVAAANALQATTQILDSLITQGYEEVCHITVQSFE